MQAAIASQISVPGAALEAMPNHVSDVGGVNYIIATIN